MKNAIIICLIQFIFSFSVFAGQQDTLVIEGHFYLDSKAGFIKIINGRFVEIQHKEAETGVPKVFIAPGLIDVQINGYMGIDFAGIEIPEEIQGESFRNIVSGKSREWRDAIYYTYYEYPSVHMVKRHYGVRTDRYKLMHFYYDIDEWEMYDLEKDPSEMKNIYDDPAYADVRENMHQKLEELRKKYDDNDELNKKFLKSYLDARKK